MTRNSENIIITQDSPTTIVEDFIAFLDYINNNKVKLTKARQYIVRKDLLAIYSLLSENNHDVSPNGNQIDYPVIHLFFHLGLRLDLIRKVGTKSNVFLIIEVNRFSS